MKIVDFINAEQALSRIATMQQQRKIWEGGKVLREIAIETEFGSSSGSVGGD